MSPAHDPARGARGRGRISSTHPALLAAGQSESAGAGISPDRPHSQPTESTYGLGAIARSIAEPAFTVATSGREGHHHVCSTRGRCTVNRDGFEAYHTL